MLAVQVTKRFTAAILVMAAVHVLVIWQVPYAWLMNHTAQETPIMDVVLQPTTPPPPLLPLPPTEPQAVPEPQELVQQVSEPVSEPVPEPVPEARPEQAEAVKLISAQQALSEQTREPVALEMPNRSVEPTQRTDPLVLESPDNWKSVTVEPEDSLVATFRPEFYERLEKRRQIKQVQQLLTSRVVERDGLPPDEYNAIDNDPTHFKTATGCFDVRPVMAGRVITNDGGGSMLWRVACKGIYKSPEEQPLLEFDDVGRVIGTR